MAPQISKITEEQVRKLVIESENPFNPLNMTFSYSYITGLVQLNWKDLLYAVENGFLSHQTAVEHALQEIQKKDDSPEEVFELAYMLQSDIQYPHSIYQLLEKLSIMQDSNDATESREKLLYVTLNWVYDHIDSYYNPVEVVDILCDEISYPDDVKALISFMPSSESQTNSHELHTKQLLDKMVVYLENQQQRWASSE